MKHDEITVIGGSTVDHHVDGKLPVINHDHINHLFINEEYNGIIDTEWRAVNNWNAINTGVTRTRGE
jgi:hypothetical protein